jgi:hypothetical protein
MAATQNLSEPLAKIFYKVIQVSVVERQRASPARPRSPENPVSRPIIPAMQAAAESLSLIVEVVRAQSPSEFSPAFAAMAKSRVDSVVVTEDGEFAASFRAIATLALANKSANALVSIPRVSPSSMHAWSGRKGARRPCARSCGDVAWACSVPMRTALRCARCATHQPCSK